MRKSMILSYVMIIVLMFVIGACTSSGEQPKPAQPPQTEQPAQPEPQTPAPTEGEKTLAFSGAGYDVFKAQNCLTCHKLGDEGSATIGPDLTTVGATMTADEIRAILTDPKSVKGEGTMMPPTSATGADLEALIEFLSNLK